jgi:hypothetical protein
MRRRRSLRVGGARSGDSRISVSSTWQAHATRYLGPYLWLAGVGWSRPRIRLGPDPRAAAEAADRSDDRAAYQATEPPIRRRRNTGNAREP